MEEVGLLSGNCGELGTEAVELGRGGAGAPGVTDACLRFGRKSLVTVARLFAL